MLLIEPISAITSWEDYEYQGHVALYIALKSILDLLQNGKSVSDYDLQIDIRTAGGIVKPKKTLQWDISHSISEKRRGHPTAGCPTISSAG